MTEPEPYAATDPAPDPSVEAELARRRRVVWLVSVLGALGVVVALIVTLVITTGSSNKNSTVIPGNRASVQSSLLTPVTTVPVKTLDTVGLGRSVALPKSVSGDPPLTAEGKPELLFIGAEFCPSAPASGGRWRSRCRASERCTASRQPSHRQPTWIPTPRRWTSCTRLTPASS